MRLGDTVSDNGGLTGRVVANLDSREFSPGLPRSEWEYLSSGIIVESDEAGLVHYPDARELTILSGS
jgi:hypothetical protein